MRKIPLVQVAAEIEQEHTALFCSYCDEEVPTHLQAENPCSLCGEYRFLYPGVATSPSGRALARPANVTGGKDVTPTVGGYAPIKKNGSKRRDSIE